MATFAKSTFSHASYAAFRPTYPTSIYETVFAYHRGPKNLAIDLGCGHGPLSRVFSPHFTKVIGSDPSNGMIKTARKITPSDEYPNVTYEVSSAESLPFLSDSSVDMVVAGQAAHWFDYPKLFKELDRVVRPGGMLAFWGYKDHVFVDYPYATKMMDDYAYNLSPDKLGSYWPQPGRSILQDKLRAIKPDQFGWKDVTRVEYEPGTEGKESGEGTLFMSKRLTVGEVKRYTRTWSSYHGWQETHEGQEARDKGGKGDVVDEVFDKIAEKVPGFKDENFEVDIEWGSGIVMARKGE